MSDRPDWLPVARWEFGRLVRRVDFVISVLLMPTLLIGGSMLVRMFGGGRGEPVSVAVVRTDAAGGVLGRGAELLPAHSGFTWVDPGAAGGDTTALAEGVLLRNYDAALVLREGEEGVPVEHDLVTRREPPRWTRDLHDVVSAQIRRERARALGLGPAELAALDDSVRFRSHVALGTRTGSRRADFLVTFAVLMLMVMIMITSVSYMMVGISAEKSARVTEVVVSAIPAQAWMDGKIIALTGVGLVVGGVWVASLVPFAAVVAFTLPGTVSVPNLLVTIVFAIGGLYLYNAMIAALMATAQSIQSASKWQSNFIALPFLPIMFMGALLDQPDATAIRVLTQVPFFSPVMVPARLVLGAIAPWELALAVALLAVACWLMRVVAGRVFRLGMLMYGKDMTLPELIRWARVR
jgi:ABC-2 type transport system permease protein